MALRVLTPVRSSRPTGQAEAQGSRRFGSGKIKNMAHTKSQRHGDFIFGQAGQAPVESPYRGLRSRIPRGRQTFYEINYNLVVKLN
jgi:hypothetical protein